jgi:hypothetical protein
MSRRLRLGEGALEGLMWGMFITFISEKSDRFDIRRFKNVTYSRTRL